MASTMVSQLPLDVWIIVLSFLSGKVVRRRRDMSALTLVACLRTSTLLREAASGSMLWKPIYEIRYEYCDEDRERTRKDTFFGNWRIMYAARRRIDNIALDYLDRLLENGAELRELGESVFDLSMDVWDVLELEANRPILSSSVDHDGHETDSDVVPPHVFTRRFWAKSLLCMLSRNYAVLTWRRFCIPSASNPTFEETMNALSCFFGYSSQQIARQLDRLAIHCRDVLVAKGVPLDPASYGYSTLVLCQEICTFMKNEGFARTHETQYHGVMTSFPHAYLTTHRKAIPISLVHVFSGIGRRLGLEISPLDLPGFVLARVVPRELNKETIIVNPSAGTETEYVVEISPAMLYPALAVQEPGMPCAAQAMLLRASRDIFSSFADIPSLTNSAPSIVYPSLLLVLCAQLPVGTRNHVLEPLADILKGMASPLDCIFLLRSLSPALPQRGREYIKRLCDGVLYGSDVRVHKRSPVDVKYFIGMPCLNSLGNLCFIVAWDIVCYLNFETTPPVNDRLERESYHLLKLDGTMQCIFLPEGNVAPTTFTEADVYLLLTGSPEVARYFSGVQLPKDPTKGVEHPDGRGRLLLSPQANNDYPEDDKAGAYWVNHGFGNDQSPLKGSSERYPSLTESVLIV